MSTGSISITSVQSVTPTQAPSSTAALSSSGDASGFGTLYQQSLTSPSQEGAEASASNTAQERTTPDNTAQEQSTQKRDTSTHDDQHGSAKRHDGTTRVHTSADDADKTARRRQQASEASAEEEESDNDLLAGMTAAQMLTNDATVSETDARQAAPGLTAVDPRATARQQQTVSDAARQSTVEPSRTNAMHQAMAMQQLVDQKRPDQNSAMGDASPLGSASRQQRQDGLRDPRAAISDTNFQVGERGRQRTASAAATAATSQNAARPQDSMVGRGNVSDSDDRSVSSPRSQADFGLQQALHQSSHGNAGIQSASTSAATLPPTDSNQWSQALASHITTMSRMDQQQATLTLAPASLGALEVNLQMDRGQADVQFVTRSRQAHDALTSSVNALHGALADQGIQLQNVSVVDHHPDAGQQTSQQQHAFNGNASSEQQSRQPSQPPQEQYPHLNEETRTAGREEHATGTDHTAVRGLRATA